MFYKAMQELTLLCFYLIVRAVQTAVQLLFQVNLGSGLLQKVGDPLHQEVSVFQVGEQKGHAILGADGERAGQHVGAVCLLHDGHLQRIGTHRE